MLANEAEIAIESQMENLANEICVQLRSKKRPLIIYPQIDALALMNDLPTVAHDLLYHFEDFIDLLQMAFKKKLSDFIYQDKPILIDENDLIVAPCLKTCPMLCKTLNEVLLADSYNGKLLCIENLHINEIHSQYYMLYYREYTRECHCQLMKSKHEALTYNNIFTLFRKSIYSSFNEKGMENSDASLHCVECHRSLTPDCSNDRFVNCTQLQCTAFYGTPITVWVLGDVLKYVEIEKGAIINSRGILIKRPKSTNSKGIVQFDIVYILMGCSLQYSLPFPWASKILDVFSNSVMTSQILKEIDFNKSITKLRLNNATQEYKDYLQANYSRVERLWNYEKAYCQSLLPDCWGLCYCLLISLASFIYNGSKDFYYNHLNESVSISPMFSQLNCSFSLPTESKKFTIKQNELQPISVLIISQTYIGFYVQFIASKFNYKVIPIGHSIPPHELVLLAKDARCILFVPHIGMMSKKQLAVIDLIIKAKQSIVWATYNKNEIKKKKIKKFEAAQLINNMPISFYKMFSIIIDINNISGAYKTSPPSYDPPELKMCDGTHLLVDYISNKVKSTSSNFAEMSSLLSFAVAHSIFNFFYNNGVTIPECISSIGIYDAMIAIILSEERIRALCGDTGEASLLFAFDKNATESNALPQSKSATSKQIGLRHDEKLAAFCEKIIACFK